MVKLKSLFPIDYTILILLIICSVVILSPIIPGVFNIKSAYLNLFLVFFLFILIVLKYSLKISELIVFLLLISAILILTIITQSKTNFNLFITFPFSLYIAWKVSRDTRLVNYLSMFLTLFVVVGLVLSWIAFFYVIQGGESIYMFKNPNGLSNNLYLTSFTNAKIGHLIRPAFIFDEPGAFSFVVCIVVVFRELLNKRRLITTLIILGGLVTLSLAHVFAVILYFIFVLNFKSKLNFALILLALMLITTDDARFNFFYDRFEIKESGTIKGVSNRTRQLDNFYNAIESNPEIIFFGNYMCHDNEGGVCVDHGDMSSNPFTPIYLGGLLLFFIQLATYFILGRLALNFRFLFSSSLIAMILLQRPYFTVMGYVFLIYIPIFYMFFNLKKYRVTDAMLITGRVLESKPACKNAMRKRLRSSKETLAKPSIS